MPQRWLGGLALEPITATGLTGGGGGGGVGGGMQDISISFQALIAIHGRFRALVTQTIHSNPK
jgi:hypothetical protein